MPCSRLYGARPPTPDENLKFSPSTAAAAREPQSQARVFQLLGLLAGRQGGRAARHGGHPSARRGPGPARRGR